MWFLLRTMLPLICCPLTSHVQGSLACKGSKLNRQRAFMGALRKTRSKQWWKKVDAHVYPITSAHSGPAAKVWCFLKLRDGLILGASPGGREHKQGFSIDQKPCASWASQAQLSVPQLSPGVDILNFTSPKHSTSLRYIKCHHCRWKHVLQLLSLHRNTCTHHLFLALMGSNYTNEVVIFISKKNYLIGENAAHICVIPRLNYRMWGNN